MLPMHRYDDPELAGFVEIWACRRRSSFQRRPSRRNFVRGYVVEVSRGMLSVFLCSLGVFWFVWSGLVGIFWLNLVVVDGRL